MLSIEEKRRRHCEAAKAWYRTNKTRKQAYDRARYLADPSRVRKLDKMWRAANPIKVRGAVVKWNTAHVDKMRAATKKWRRANPKLARACDNARRKRVRTATPAWADRKAIRAIYERCPSTHHVDHIIPLKGKTVSGLHVETNLQYLPAVENLKKHNRLLAA